MAVHSHCADGEQQRHVQVQTAVQLAAAAVAMLTIALMVRGRRGLGSCGLQ
jgi:hypothetical protein